MIAKQYQKNLENALNSATYLLLVLLVGSLQLVKQVKLERLAQSLPLPILFESRRKKLRRFLRLEAFSLEKIWLPGVRSLLAEMVEPGAKIYLALDRTCWGGINILMVSLIYDHRAWPIYWEFLAKKGSSNLAEQKRVLGQSLGLLSEYSVVVLGDREFCSPKLGKWLGLAGVSFCLRQKGNTKISGNDAIYQELRGLGLTAGMSLFLNDQKVTRARLGGFNIACKWKRTYRGFKTKEPWFILTNLSDVETAISAYQKRFGIEEMFRDFKAGGYNLEGGKLAAEQLDKLLIVVSIAYTSAMLEGQDIKKMGMQKYVTRPEPKGGGKRRHSAFFVGHHLDDWLRLNQLCQETVDQLLKINRRWLNHYKTGQRAVDLILSTL